MKGLNESYRNFDKDISLDNLYSALIECFSVILCGYIAGRLNLISLRETKGIDVFVRAFSLPSVIFTSLAQLDVSTVNWKFLGSILVSKSIVFAGVILVTLFLSRPIRFGKLGLYAVFCTQSNDFALGYPILNALYGGSNNYASYVYLLAPISLAILNPIACVLLEIEKINNGELSEADDKRKTSCQDPAGRIIGEDSEAIGNTNDDIIGNNENSDADFSKRQKSNFKIYTKIFLNIITNPIMVMTILGLIGNLFYKYIKFVDVVLNAFAKVFSTCALFLLGLKMVGSVHKLKGESMITPGILIITKLLVLPLITREVVSLLHTGTDPNDSLSLSTFGFMYGTFPTAPMAFVLASHYEVDVEIVSSSLVVCTLLSAPLMYISAKMIFLGFVPDGNYYQKLESFAFNVGIVGIPVALWLLVLFIANRSFSKIPHKITGFLIISQVFICIGAILEPVNETFKPWSTYLQFSLLTFGMYSSRLLTFFLSATLVLLQSRSLCFVLKLIPAFFILASGIPVIAIVAECLVSFPDGKYDFGSLINPDFRYGKFQSIVTLLFLVVSFVGTIVCLILQHRYQRRFSKYLVLVRDVNSKDLEEVNESSATCSQSCVQVTDIEEIVTENKHSICRGNCNDEALCSSSFDCTESEREICEQTIRNYNVQAINEEMDEDRQDKQISRHVVLLIALVTSMFVNLMLSVWTLVIEDAISGIYVELLFLNVILNFGQIFVTFAVFGFDCNILLSTITNRWRKFYYGAETIVLTPVEELGFETTHVCHQFIAHHLRECENEIAKNKRLRLRLYKKCFKGETFVLWLLKKRLAKDEAEAIQYACHLLEGRVLRHVENRHHFENSALLYTFVYL